MPTNHEIHAMFADAHEKTIQLRDQFADVVRLMAGNIEGVESIAHEDGVPPYEVNVLNQAYEARDLMHKVLALTEAQVKELS